MGHAPDDLTSALDDLFAIIEESGRRHGYSLTVHELGTVTYIGRGVAHIKGLSGLQADELVQFPGNVMGMAFNLDPNEAGIVMLGESSEVSAGSEVRRTGRVMDVPVGEALLGRVVDPLGRPLDDLGPVRTSQFLPAEREAPQIMDRLPVTVPLQTGIKSIDALVPIGRGQRELILGDRQTGKTAIALDTIINQRDKNVLCVYCSIGQRSSSVAKVVENLRERRSLDHTVVLVASGEEPPGIKFIAPYSATTMAEYFMEQGQDLTDEDRYGLVTTEREVLREEDHF